MKVENLPEAKAEENSHKKAQKTQEEKMLDARKKPLNCESIEKELLK